MSSIQLNSISSSASNYAFFKSSSTQLSASSGATTSFQWNSTAKNTNSLGGTWSTDGSKWTPGKVGVYLVIWNTNGLLPNAGTNGVTAEFSIFKNDTSLVYGTASQIGLSTTNQTCPEVPVITVFNSTSVTDFIYFTWYNPYSAAQTIATVGDTGRNTLSITKIAGV